MVKMATGKALSNKQQDDQGRKSKKRKSESEGYLPSFG